MIRNVLALLTIAIVLIELDRLLRGYWLRRLQEKQKKRRVRGNRPFYTHRASEIVRIAVRVKGNQHCQNGKCRLPGESERRGERKKRISTAGYFCLNRACAY